MKEIFKFSIIRTLVSLFITLIYVVGSYFTYSQHGYSFTEPLLTIIVGVIAVIIFILVYVATSAYKKKKIAVIAFLMLMTVGFIGAGLSQNNDEILGVLYKIDCNNARFDGDYLLVTSGSRDWVKVEARPSKLDELRSHLGQSIFLKGSMNESNSPLFLGSHDNRSKICGHPATTINFISAKEDHFNKSFPENPIPLPAVPAGLSAR